MNKFSERLKELRQEKKLKQWELADDIGVAQSSICRWEQNEAEPHIDVLIKLAELFNCTVGYLVGTED